MCPVSSFWEWLIISGVVVAFNVTPLFATPTVAVLGYFEVVRGKDPLQLALMGGLAGARGKVILAYLSRLVSNLQI